MSTVLRIHKVKIAIAAAVVIAAASAIGLYLTKPYGVYADGTKVEEPYVVTADGKELFVVKDEKTAEQVIKAVMDEYSPEGAQINSITVDRKLSTKDKELKRGEEPPVVMTKKEAVDYVLKENGKEKPLFSVTINAEIGSVTGIEAGETYEDTEELYEDDTEVKTEGTNGSQIVTNNVISVNGNVLTTEVVDTAVVNESRPTIIYRGTKERPQFDAAAYGGQVLGDGNGATIANYALQFVGNPYVYGGTSLTNGADCSGFVYAVYQAFGIGIPRVGAEYAGKSVPLSEAKAGDILTYSGHYALYIGGGQVVHALNESAGICVSSMYLTGTPYACTRIVE